MNEAIVDSLIRLVIDDDHKQGDARVAALDALNELNATSVAPTLASYLEAKLSDPLKLHINRSHYWVAAMIDVLSGLGFKDGADILVGALSRNVDHRIHIAAAKALGKFKYEPAIAPLARWIAHGYGTVQGDSANAIYATCDAALVQIGTASLSTLLLFLNAPFAEVEGPNRARIVRTIVNVMKSSDERTQKV